MSRLRIALPALKELSPDTQVFFARLSNQGDLIETGRSALLQLGPLSGIQPIEAFLHPLDSLLSSIEVPPLPASRVRDAAMLAAQGLILGGSEHLHIACSPRYADGHVYLGWLPREALVRLTKLLSQCRLSLRGLYPAPFGLPVPASGQVSVCLRDEHWLLRHSAERGCVQPRLTENPDIQLAEGRELHWLDGEGPEGPDTSAGLSLSGPSPGWSLHSSGKRSAASSTSGWTTAVLCCGFAMGTWAVGLNLYAAREAAIGRQLKADMTQRVSQAFPQLPIILNPLQQARQQVAALGSGRGSGANAGFEQLVKHTAEALPFMAGSVESLTYSDGRLQLQVLPDIVQPAVDDTLQKSLAQAGVTGSRAHLTWTFIPLVDQIPEADPSTEDSVGD
ncbi:general secretion pathway protein L [Pseudomonas syringae]|uniref:type II secretion system protein GspL n=1 Tax=Pseudomonas syringae TaxID=317 RepID=UPI000894491D|nr:type II secretion system protein GspL [Pseudomonas syringae]SDX56049.1 general secretion pathway protein L [Pseudomonas syringae]SFM66925.1 general secretion pathway protein L [Pseudomonas syringae]